MHYKFAYKAPPSEAVVEVMGRLELDGPPDFHYLQEGFMFDLQKGKRWTWSVMRPCMIRGFTFGKELEFFQPPLFRCCGPFPLNIEY